MSTKVSQFMGGLGIDARNKFDVASNATVTVGGSGTGNVILGGQVAINETAPDIADTLIVGGNIRLTSGQIIFADGSGQSVGSTIIEFPTGDYGLLDAANAAVDAFGQDTSGSTTFDMLNSPLGSVSGEDLGALS